MNVKKCNANETLEKHPKRKKHDVKTLSPKLIDWIMNFQEDHSLSPKERGMFDVCRKVARKHIADLTALAAYLPENQQRQVFTKDRMQQLIRHMFSAADVDPKTLPTKDDLATIQKPRSLQTLPREKRMRLLELCDCTLNWIGSPKNAHALAPENWRPIEAASHETFPFHSVPSLKTIIYQAQIEREKESARKKKSSPKGVSS